MKEIWSFTLGKGFSAMAGMRMSVFTRKEGVYLSALRAGDKVHIVCLVDEIIEYGCTLIFSFRIAE